MFVGNSSLVTYNKGLKSLSELSDSNIDAMSTNLGKVNVHISKGYDSRHLNSKLVDLTIHTEDGSDSYIHIKCSEDTKFILRNQELCVAKNLKGKRLISLGQNAVYCTKVTPISTPEMLYDVFNSDRNGDNRLFINGICTELK